MQKPQFSIKSQTGVMAKKLKKLKKKGGNGGVKGGPGRSGVGAGEMQWFWREVHGKTPGLYQVPNWSYGYQTKNTQKRGDGGVKGGPGGSGVKGRSWGDAGVLGGDSRENPRSLSGLEGVGHEIWPYLAVKLHSA